MTFPEDWIYRPYFNLPDTMFGPIPDYAVDADYMEAAVEHIDPRARAYLQDYNLFADDLDEIREYFFPSERALDVLQGLPQTFDWPTALGVHVRRGDNVIDPGVPNKSDYHLCPGLDYYERGIGRQWRDFPDRRNLAVFSDDIPWCRENLPIAKYYGDGRAYWKEHEDLYGVDTPHDWIDLFTLARCNYFVVSGSTFGIWGALIAGVPDSHVVRPDKVYGPLLDFIDESLMFPPDWKVISHAS